MTDKGYSFVSHEFGPVFDSRSKVLVLGTIPSVQSRRLGFFYSHPQNRFWKILSELFLAPLPLSIDAKKALLLDNRIAIWDVLKSCDIINSDDSSIKNAVPNDLSIISGSADIRAVFTTGTKATKLYEKYRLEEQTGLKAQYLPSPSPANCSKPYNEIINEYQKIKKYLQTC